MKTLQVILGMLITVAYILFYGNDAGLNLAIAPFVIPAALSGISGLANLFSGDEKKHYTKQDLIDAGYEDFDPEKAKGDLARLLSSRRKSRSAAVETRNNQLGFNNPTDVYSNELGFEDAQVQGNVNIDEQNRQEENAIAGKLFDLNAANDSERESDFSKIFSGALKGSEIGFNLQDILGKSIGSNTPDPGRTIEKGSLENLGKTISGLKGTSNSIGGNYDNSNQDDFTQELADILGKNKKRKYSPAKNYLKFY